MMKRLNLAAISILLLLFNKTAVSVSFDCAKAITFVEKAICSEKHLSSLDDLLALAYQKAFANTLNLQELKAEQKTWLTAVRNQCPDSTCLENAYRQRILMLDTVTKPVFANLIFNGSFEQPLLTDHSWAVFKNIPSWVSTSGAGIEIQHNVAGTPFDGNQYVELDSNNNSSMSQTVSTVPGTQYLLSVAYSPRPGVPLRSNGIQVLFDGEPLGTVQQNGCGLSDTKFTKYIFEVTPTKNTNIIEFRAVGDDDGVGGYLDDVILAPSSTLPVIDKFPAGSWIAYNFAPLHEGQVAFTIMPDGNPACASYNGKDCLWGVSYDQIEFGQLAPLVCGERHRSQWGITGYENPTHWCRLFQKFAKN